MFAIVMCSVLFMCFLTCCCSVCVDCLDYVYVCECNVDECDELLFFVFSG